MADFQIIESQRSLPGAGTGIHQRPVTETGQGEMYRVLGDLGAGVFKLGQIAYEKQAIAETTQKTFEANEEFIKMHQAMAEENDPEKYWQMFDDTWQRVSSADVKNPEARERYNAALVQMRKGQAMSVLAEYRSRTDENYRMATANIEAQAITKRNPAIFENYGKMQAQKGRMGKDEYEIRLDKVRDDVKSGLHSDAQQSLSTFAYQYPETILSWKTADDMMKNFPNAKPTDLTWIQGVAQNAINIRTIQKNERISKYYGEVNRLAAQSFDKSIPPEQRPPPTNVVQQILKLDGDLTDEDRIALVKEYNTAFEILNKTGVDLYSNRPTDKYQEMRTKVLSGQVKNELEIRQWTGKQDGYGLPQENDLIDLFNGKASTSKAFEDSAVVKNVLYPSINGISFAGKELPGDLKAYAREYALRLLEDAINRAEPPMKEREKREEAIRISRNIKQMVESGTFEIEPETLPKTPKTREEQIAAMEAEWDKIPLAKLPKTKQEKRIERTARNSQTGERIGWDGEKWIKL